MPFLTVVVKVERRKVLVMVLFMLFGSTYIIYFLLQQNTEKEVKESLLFEQEQDQKQAVRFIALNTESDLKMIKATLSGLANSETVQTEPLTSNSTENLMQQSYEQINSIVDRLFLINKTGIIVVNIVPPGEDKFLGSNLSKRADWVRETLLTEEPVFSKGYVGLDGKYRIGMTMPIVNSTTSEFVGLFGALVPVNQFFEHYGNIYDVNSEFLTAYDSNGTVLVTPRIQLVGHSVFGNVVQEFVKGNPIYNRIFESVTVKGRADTGVYDIPAGQFLNTAYPIKMDDKPVYSVAIITPTSTIYSAVNKTLQTSIFGVTILLGAITLAIVLLSLLLYGWQRDLRREVLSRTKDLEEANGRLTLLNDGLVANERAKAEFISMVSHELRTPVVPIKAYAGMLLNPKYTGETNPRQRKAITSILHNVTSLERLVGDMLDVYKIEMDRLKLSKSKINIKELLDNFMSEFRVIIRIQDSEKEIRLEADIRISPALTIQCDPQRLTQVLGNLVKNSIDFVPTKGGRITIRVEDVTTMTKDDGDGKGDLASIKKKDFVQNELIEGNSESEKAVLFTVKDNGSGFPADKVDHVFQKFYQIDTSFTRKHGGTGLGLVICKGIVESHGGKIWIDREYHNGASISFTIPIIE